MIIFFLHFLKAYLWELHQTRSTWHVIQTSTPWTCGTHKLRFVQLATITGIWFVIQTSSRRRRRNAIGKIDRLFFTTSINIIHRVCCLPRRTPPWSIAPATSSGFLIDISGSRTTRSGHCFHFDSQCFQICTFWVSTVWPMHGMKRIWKKDKSNVSIKRETLRINLLNMYEQKHI